MKVALFLSSATSQQNVNIVIIGVRHVTPSCPTIMKGRLCFDKKLLDTVSVVHTSGDILDYHPIPRLCILTKMLIPPPFRVVGNSDLDPPIITQEKRDADSQKRNHIFRETRIIRTAVFKFIWHRLRSCLNLSKKFC